MSFELLMAWRYLWARQGFIRVVTIFSFVGIVLGVAALIVVMSVMSGFRVALLQKIVGINGHVIVYPPTLAMSEQDIQSLKDKIQNVQEVKLAVPFLAGRVLLEGASRSTGVLLRGIPPEMLSHIPIFEHKIDIKSLKNFETSSSILLGSRLAHDLDVSPGGRVIAFSPHGPSTPFGTVPQVQTYAVAGTFTIGMAEYDDILAFLPLRQAQTFFNRKNQITGFQVFGRSADMAEKIEKRLAKVLGPGYAFVTWQASNQTFFQALEVEREVMFVILSLILLVASFNIISSLVMMVKDKVSDIAIFRTMGASRGRVMRIFFFLGAIIGVSGTFIGTLLGVITSWKIETLRRFLSHLFGVQLFPPDVYSLSRMPSHLTFSSVSFVVLLALLLSILATIYPAWRASRIDPARALREG